MRGRRRKDNKPYVHTPQYSHHLLQFVLSVANGDVGKLRKDYGSAYLGVLYGPTFASALNRKLVDVSTNKDLYLLPAGLALVEQLRNADMPKRKHIADLSKTVSDQLGAKLTQMVTNAVVSIDERRRKTA